MTIVKTIKWGIIGCGNVTEVKSGPAFRKIPNSELVAVMRRSKEKVKKYAIRHHVPRWYTNADELIADTEVNAVYIATPPDTHALYAIKALKAGKAVYCEKPMALNGADCQAMLEASYEYNQPLYVAYYRRGQSYFHKVKELIESHAIGQLLTVNLRLMKAPKPEDYAKKTLTWRVKPEISGGGYFIDLAPHQLDILQYLLGTITKVKSVVTNQMQRYEAEDVVSTAFQFENGVVGAGLWCFSVAEGANEDIIDIIGTKGKISFSTFGYTPIELTSVDVNKTFEIGPPKHAQQPYIETIVRELQGLAKSPADIKTAVETTKLTDSILRHYYQK